MTPLPPCRAGGNPRSEGSTMARPGPVFLSVALLVGTGGLVLCAQDAHSGASSKLPFCSLESGLKAKNDGVNGAGGNSIFYIVYVNSGSVACVLRGNPGVQPVAGPT